MTDKDLRQLLNTFEKALNTLGECLALEYSTVVRDAAIKRFEYCFELAWKTIKQFARQEGEACNSPKSALKVAFNMNWVNGDEIWLDMLDDRNQTTHTYTEATAKHVFSHIPGYYEAFLSLLQSLQKVI